MGPTAVRISPVWESPLEIVELVRSAGPFWPLANYGASDAEMAALGGRPSTITPPWFRQDFARESKVLVPGAEVILTNEHFVRAAGQLGGGADAVVRPQAVYVNIMGPTPFALPPHLDIPAFRGFTRATEPLWLLKTMKTSGLFEAWRTKIATGVSWFYGGVGGDFHYWPDGPDGAMAVERSPFDNVSVLSDNEYTFHGVAPLGATGAMMPEGLTHESRLVRGESGWDVHDGEGNRRAGFADDDVRITISWKADVFADAEEADAYDHGHDALTLDAVVEMFGTDLTSRGIEIDAPTDPLTDQRWIGTLASTYQDPAPSMR